MRGGGREGFREASGSVVETACGAQLGMEVAAPQSCFSVHRVQASSCSTFWPMPIVYALSRLYPSPHAHCVRHAHAVPHGEGPRTSGGAGLRGTRTDGP